MTEAKFIALEALIAHQDRHIQDLSDMVAKQWGEIDQLKTRLDIMQDKLKSVEHMANSATKSADSTSLSDCVAAEKPPHY